jgi:5,10-methylenetetrahydromethanopterin reductase
MERIAVGFNPTISAKEAAEFARLSEENGFESFWIHENPFIKDAISLLSSAAAATSKIKVASGCVSVVTRHPLLAATSFVALNDMSGGRAIMGVGLGGFPWLPKIGVNVFPVQQTRPMRRIKEFLTITNALLRGESISLDGEFFKVTDIKLEAKPSQRPQVYLATFGRRLLALASSVADGVVVSPALMTPEVTEKNVGFVRRGEKHGKEIDIASYVLTTVSKDPVKARELMKSYYFLLYQVADVLKPEIFAPYGIGEKDLEPVKEAWRRRDIQAAAKAMPDGIVEALTLTGDADHCLDRLKDYRKAGVKLPIIMPIGDIKAAITAFAAS